MAKQGLVFNKTNIKIVKIIKTKNFASCLLAAGALATMNAAAQQIGPGAFGTGTTTEKYDNLGLPFDNSTPLVIGGDTYTTDNGTLRYDDGFGPDMGTTGGAIGTDTDTGFINIQFGSTAQQAGISVGVDGPWTATVSFFDGAALLGSVPLSGSGNDNGFAGWENTGGITSLVITDTDANGLIILADNLMLNGSVSPVPDGASTFSLLGLGLLGLQAIRRRLVK